MVCVGWPLRRSRRAASLRWKPSRRIARSTLAAVSGITLASPFTTRDTVIGLTPAARATSRMVGRTVIPAPG